MPTGFVGDDFNRRIQDYVNAATSCARNCDIASNENARTQERRGSGPLLEVQLHDSQRPKLSDPARERVDCNQSALAGFAAAHG